MLIHSRSTSVGSSCSWPCSLHFWGRLLILAMPLPIWVYSRLLTNLFSEGSVIPSRGKWKYSWLLSVIETDNFQSNMYGKPWPSTKLALFVAAVNWPFSCSVTIALGPNDAWHAVRGENYQAMGRSWFSRKGPTDWLQGNG